MTIYFAGSIRGGRDDAALYHDIIGFLKTMGPVFTEHVGDPSLTARGDDGPDDPGIYRRDMDWLAQSRVVVAEVTQPSLGVGYELGAAVAMGIPVLALYRPKPGRCLSAMIAGCPSISVGEYQSLDEAKTLILNFLNPEDTESRIHE